jgi:CheY-specific phosphatase CheX
VAELEQILDRVTEEALETMFFSAILGPASPTYGDDAVTAMVEFAGSDRGVLRLSADRATATTHTANFLGLSEEEAPLEEIHAVVGELANVICGATLAQIRPDGRFLISPPRVFTGGEAARDIDEMPVVRKFELADGSLMVGLSVGSGAAAV